MGYEFHTLENHTNAGILDTLNSMKPDLENKEYDKVIKKIVNIINSVTDKAHEECKNILYLYKILKNIYAIEVYEEGSIIVNINEKRLNTISLDNERDRGIYEYRLECTSYIVVSSLLKDTKDNEKMSLIIKDDVCYRNKYGTVRSGTLRYSNLLEDDKFCFVQEILNEDLLEFKVDLLNKDISLQNYNNYYPSFHRE